ncbi:hypothetical protein T484DRAFT_2617845 [Baffinella frigidus]|nr:hypothetical protein T484DRAFT_2617845 [Cryptophyta sp. CCMP2293]
MLVLSATFSRNSPRQHSSHQPRVFVTRPRRNAPAHQPGNCSPRALYKYQRHDCVRVFHVVRRKPVQRPVQHSSLRNRGDSRNQPHQDRRSSSRSRFGDGLFAKPGSCGSLGSRQLDASPARYGSGNARALDKLLQEGVSSRRHARVAVQAAPSAVRRPGGGWVLLVLHGLFSEEQHGPALACPRDASPGGDLRRFFSRALNLRGLPCHSVSTLHNAPALHLVLLLRLLHGQLRQHPRLLQLPRRRCGSDERRHWPHHQRGGCRAATALGGEALAIGGAELQRGRRRDGLPRHALLGLHLCENGGGPPPGA